MVYRTVNLRVPVQSEERGSEFDVRPRNVEKWISNLPFTNVGKSTRLIYETLLELNRRNIPNANRVKVMELFRPKICLLLDVLKKYYIGSQFPLSEKSRKVCRLVHALQIELATGYKIVLVDGLSDGSSWRNSKLMTKALQRAMSSLNGVLLTAYQTYTPAPKGMWGEIHELYRLAVENRLEFNVVKDDENRLAIDTNICNTYKQIMLLSLSNPYYLQQVDVEKVYGALGKWAFYCLLSDGRTEGIDSGEFVVDLSDDSPPCHVVFNARERTPDQRILNTANMLRVIQNETQKKGKQFRLPSGEFVAESVVDHLFVAWGGAPKRGFLRTSKTAQMQVTFGIDATHYFITKSRASQASKRLFRGRSSRAEYSSRMIVGLSNMDEEADVWERRNAALYKREIEPNIRMANGANVRGKVEQSSIYSSYPCDVVNESVGGMCLCWEENMDARLLVGELIGVCEQSEEGAVTWRVGVIRWIKKAPQAKHFEFGVQVLASHPRAVATRILKSRNSRIEYVRSLLLPALASTRQPSTLIAPAILYQPEDALTVVEGSDERNAKLLKLQESTSSFCRFECRFAKQVSNKVKPIKPSADGQSIDDSTWSAL
ncbi:MAG: hypothetical protein GXP10_04250 [Gammaproteobacteria bacterium]|nr:hypothetical protein [Gammaproteobacteria bacterium]